MNKKMKKRVSSIVAISLFIMIILSIVVTLGNASTNTDVQTKGLKNDSVEVEYENNQEEQVHSAEDSTKLIDEKIYPTIEQSLGKEFSSPKDISNIVDINLYNMSVDKNGVIRYIIKEGKKGDSIPEIVVGNKVITEYRWAISQENMNKIEGEDYFKINLPAPQNIISVDGVFKLLSSIDQEELGIYRIKNGIITIILNDVAAGKQELKNGFFKVEGRAEKVGEKILIDAEIGVTIDIKPSPDEPGGPGGNDGGKEPFPSYKLKFLKDGEKYYDINKLNWHLQINYDELAKMFTGTKMVGKKHIILEDILPDNVMVDQDSFVVTIPVFVPTDGNDNPDKNGQMSGLSICYLKLKIDVEMLGVETTYEDLYKKISTSETPERKIYIYENKKIFIYLGDLPSSNLTYDQLAIDFGLNNLAERIQQALDEGLINQNQADQMKYIYGPEGPTNGHIICYDISFDTFVTGDSGYYTNNAILHWDEVREDGSSYEIKFEKADAGVEPLDARSIRIEKKDDIGNILPGITFKLQKLNELTGDYIDYIPLDNGKKERITDKKGKVQFDKLENGRYKIVEVKGLAGYGKPIYNPSDKFEIKDTDKYGLEFFVENPRKVPKETMVKVSKIWDDEGNDRKRPTKIQVQLFADGDKSGDVITIEESMGWSYTWKHLPIYNNQNAEIEYTIKELNIPKGYKNTVDDKNKHNIVITNTYTLEEPGESPRTPKTPATGDRKIIGLWISLCTISVMCVVMIKIYLRGAR